MPAVAVAMDVLVLPSPQVATDARNEYKNAVLLRALELTRPEFGDFELNLNGPKMKRLRALSAIRTGELINTYFSVESPEWEENAIRIDVPIRRGIVNYRLLLVHRDNANVIGSANSVQDLRRFTAGVQSDWSTKGFLERYGMPTVAGESYKGLFVMLAEKRFDYLLRGVHEVYQELEHRADVHASLVVAPDIALYMPLSTYTYVSPASPRIAERLTLGLNRMLQSGELNAMFRQYFQSALDKADLCQRRLLFFSEEDKQQHVNRSLAFIDPCEAQSE
ncbi:transporter substrate-binding domain-containing protein [Simiduia agarivorans]|nr:transporter substrate-binding domain-containing protein [Simiduia agarivorans]